MAAENRPAPRVCGRRKGAARAISPTAMARAAWVSGSNKPRRRTTPAGRIGSGSPNRSGAPKSPRPDGRGAVFDAKAMVFESVPRLRAYGAPLIYPRRFKGISLEPPIGNIRGAVDLLAESPRPGPQVFAAIGGISLWQKSLAWTLAPRTRAWPSW